MKFIGFDIVVYNITTYEIIAVFKEYNKEVQLFLDSRLSYHMINTSSKDSTSLLTIDMINKANNTDF